MEISGRSLMCLLGAMRIIIIIIIIKPKGKSCFLVFSLTADELLPANRSLNTGMGNEKRTLKKCSFISLRV